MVSINKLSVQFGGYYLFKNISFLIDKKDRIGLTGKNGAGKSTLLKIISGIENAETGSIEKSKDIIIGYLPQEKLLNNTLSVFDEAKKAFSEIINIKNRINLLSQEISSRTDYESEDYLYKTQLLHDLNERFDLVNGNKADQETEKVLKGLGFLPSDFNKPLNTFSGGWQMRVELAKILLQKPNLILLDEPTNHLDIESIQWLENELATYNGAVILVSHDRTFLDKITKRTIEIMNQQIYDYKTNYSEYLIQRAELIENQKTALEKQQSEIQNIEKFIERFRYKSTKAKQVQSRIKFLEKMDKIEVDKIDTSAIRFLFPPAPNSGRVVVDLQDISKNYGTKKVLSNIDLTIERGDFVAFIGRNGEGKTTLARIINGDLDFNGSCTYGNNVKIGYFAQNQNELLDSELTVFETIDNIAVGDARQKIRPLLGSFLFDSDDINKKVKVLSGGEKTRLSLIKLLLEPVNLLILDEPTNHLDMTSKDILKNALIHYNGTVIIVSHDRDFLQGLTNKIFEFKNHKIKTFLGDIFEFIESRNIQSLKDLEVARVTKSADVQNKSTQKDIYETRKNIDRNIRKIESNISKIENEITELETEQFNIEEKLKSSEIQANSELISELYLKYSLNKESLDEKMEIWNNLHLDLEIEKEKRE